MSALPVRWRLTLAFAAVMAILLAATGAFVHERLASSLDRAVDRTLRARAADVSALAEQSDSGLREARDAGGGRRPAELAQLIDAAGRVLDRTPGLSAQPLITPAAIGAARGGAVVTTDVRLAAGRPVRLLAQRVRAQDQTLVVVVGQSLQDRDQALRDLTGVLLVGGPAALLLASLAGFLLTGAALRPVAASVARERAFVSDASHELRSPLAMLRTELELIARERPAGPALQSAVRSAVAETDRLGQLADDLLLLARADDRELPVALTIEPAGELLRAAAARARLRHPGAAVAIAVDAPADVVVLADRNRVAQALDNLVANGLRYAATRVQLTARAHDAWVELHVVDDGPGFPEGFLPRAWQRFARADVARTEDGSGLGLAIVRTIVELHGGEAHAANRPGGGADVWITLPRPLSPRGAGARLRARRPARAARGSARRA